MIPDLFTPPSSARLSKCGRYRYNLTRSWATGPSALFVMLNPSTATVDIDDPTIRKCVGFARRLGYSGIEVVNLFAVRSTDPAGVLAVADPVGPDNDSAITDALDRCPLVICAWGAHATGMLKRVGPVRIEEVLRLLRRNHVPCCLGKSADGSPRHPLMLPYSAQLVSFEAA